MPRSRSNEDLLIFRRDNLQLSSSDGEAPAAVRRLCCGGSIGGGRNFEVGVESFALGSIIVFHFLYLISVCVLIRLWWRNKDGLKIFWIRNRT